MRTPLANLPAINYARQVDPEGVFCTRRLGRLCVLIVTQVLLTLLLTEVAVRLLTPLNEDFRQLNYNPALTGGNSQAKSLPDLLARTRRGFRPFVNVGDFRTNSQGLRTAEYSADAGSGYRIVTLGDSFTFAGETPYRLGWPKLLETRLRETHGGPLEVVNLGYPGVGPKFELRMWQIEGSRLNADLVIQAFYVGNDFLDGLKIRIEPFTIGQALFDHSALYRVVRNLYRLKTEEAAAPVGKRLKRPRRRKEARHDEGGFEIEGYRVRSAEHATFRPKRYDGIVAHTMQVSRISNRSRFEAAFRKGEPILLETRQAVEASGARYLLVILPSEFQVDPDVARGGLEFKGTALDEYEVDWPQKRFETFCEERRVDCLDLLPAFRERGRTRKLYWLRNTHWNVEGNALAAEQLVDFLRERIPEGG